MHFRLPDWAAAAPPALRRLCCVAKRWGVASRETTERHATCKLLMQCLKLSTRARGSWKALLRSCKLGARPWWLPRGDGMAREEGQQEGLDAALMTYTCLPPSLQQFYALFSALCTSLSPPRRLVAQASPPTALGGLPRH